MSETVQPPRHTKEPHMLDVDANDEVTRTQKIRRVIQHGLKQVVAIEPEEPRDSWDHSSPYQYVGWRQGLTSYRPSNHSEPVPPKSERILYDDYQAHGGRLYDNNDYLAGSPVITGADGQKITDFYGFDGYVGDKVRYDRAMQEVGTVNRFLSYWHSLHQSDEKQRKEREGSWNLDDPHGSPFGKIPVPMHNFIVMNIINNADRNMEKSLKLGKNATFFDRREKQKARTAWENGEGYNPEVHLLAQLLHQTSNLSLEATRGLIKWGEAKAVIENLDSLADEVSFDDIVKSLIQHGQADELAEAGRYDLIERISPELKEEVIKSLTRKEKAQLREHVKAGL